MGLEQCGYSFFLKLLPSASIHGSEPGRKLVREAGLFQREIEANFRVLSHLKRFASSTEALARTEFSSSPTTRRRKSAGGGHHWDIDISSPEIVYGCYNPNGNGVIVLLDVTTQVWQFFSHMGIFFVAVPP